MPPVPMELPIRAGEACALAELVLDHAGNRNLTAGIRGRIASRTAAAQFSSITPYPGSLARDPIHPTTFYMAVDPGLLLRLALFSSPSSGLFPNSVLIGRMRTAPGEVVVNAIPFGAGDWDNIRKFASVVDRDFLPRTTGAAPAIEGSAPLDFEEYRAVLKSTGANLAAVRATPSNAAEVWHRTLWNAIRAGWREGWTATLALSSLQEMAETQAQDFTRFSMPAGHAGEIYAALQEARPRRAFDCEIDCSRDRVTEPSGMGALLRDLRAHNRPVQFIAPSMPDTTQLGPLFEAARQANALLSLSGIDPALVGKITGGRVNYQASGDIVRLAGLLRP